MVQWMIQWTNGWYCGLMDDSTIELMNGKVDINVYEEMCPSTYSYCRAMLPLALGHDNVERTNEVHDTKAYDPSC